MVKVRTDKALVDEFLDRSVEAIYPSRDELYKKLMSGDRIRAFQGFDPTGPYLHVGHAMGIRSMRILQELGHEVIFLLGEFTARVGDPDKDKGRDMLSVEQIQKNLEGWKEQAAQLIDFEGENPVVIKSNFDWLSELKLEQLIELMSHMTVQRMLERDMFERRYKNNDPIRLQEFIYPLMQGYDSVAMDIDIEICGADQTFNALTGRQLVKDYLGKEKFVRANKMMDAPTGKTMSKTKGNGINLSDTANDMYGKAMSYPDTHITMALECLTSIPLERVAEIQKEIDGGANPMEFKKFMAYQIVKEVKGDDAAKEAEAFFQSTVQNKEVPDDIPTVNVGADSIGLLDAIVDNGLASSKGEARRLVEQGGVSIDGEKVTDVHMEVALNDSEKLLKVGKRQYLNLKK